MASDPMALANALDPNLYQQQLQAAQQQQLATLLMQQGLAPMSGTESVGGVAIRRSPMEGAAKLAALLSGQSMQGQANDKAAALMAGQSAAMRAAFGMGDPQAPQAPQGGQGPALGAVMAGQPVPGQPPPQQAPQGGPMSVAGASPMTNMMSYMTDPAAHMKAVIDQYASTPEMKQAAAAFGVGSPGYMKALQDLVYKAGYVAPEEVKQGNTTLDPRTHLPIAFGVKVPDGAQPTFNRDGSMARVDMVPGAADAMTTGKLAETGNDIVDVPLGNGQTQKMTKAQFLAKIGGGATPYNFDVKPGTESDYRAALERSGNLGALAAFDAKFGGKMPGMTTGQSTADREGSMIGAKDVVGRNQAILADANAAPQDIESLNKMVELTKSAQFGPGASNVARWKAMAAQFPGMNLIVDPQSLEQQQANVTEMKKYMSNMAGRMSGSSGTGTDARLQNAIDSLPNDAAPNEAIRRVAPMLIAQRTARVDEARLRSSFGNDSAAIQSFETKWRGAYDPLAYEATLATKGMTPIQAAQFVAKNYTPTQAAQIAQSRAALRALGVQF